MIELRDAVLADAGKIARLHVSSWRAAYSDLAPAPVFAAMDGALRLARWTATLESPSPHQVVLAAWAGERLLGVGAASEPSEPLFGDRGELKSIYVDPGAQRMGVGRRLMGALAGRLADRGYGGAALGVVEGNEAAMAFYTALGAREIGRYVDPGPLWRSTNIALAWDDLSFLAASSTTS